MLAPACVETILACTGAKKLSTVTEVTSLWSGYGKILRVGLVDAEVRSVIVKQIAPDGSVHQPRGWNSDQSHARKLRSYEVEAHWYRGYVERNLAEDWRVARPLAVQAGTDLESPSEMLLVLEDLDASGFPIRHSAPSFTAMDACLRWLASFHASHLDSSGEGLWEEGTYWHLGTRPDELAAMDQEHPLRRNAALLDRVLREAPFPTLVHGDAKVANFCFTRDDRKVAAVDFQYVGRGCGMKDVAYFLGSCLDESQCEQHAGSLLQDYFRYFRVAAAARRSERELDELERHWRRLYPVAWADFHRFLLGWCPGHPKCHGYTERMTELAPKGCGHLAISAGGPDPTSS